MRLIEPGFAAGSCELTVGRMRPVVDPAVDAAVDAALAAAGLQVADVAGFDFAAVVEATDVIIDFEAYQANAHLIPQLDRLSPQMRRNMTEAAAITADQYDAANQTRRQVRDWFAATLDHHPFLVLPTLVGAPPLLGERRIPLTVLTMPANLASLPALALPIPGPIPGPNAGSAPGLAGLPASLQIIGPPGGEEQLIALGRVIEASLDASPPGTRSGRTR